VASIGYTAKAGVRIDKHGTYAISSASVSASCFGMAASFGAHYNSLDGKINTSSQFDPRGLFKNLGNELFQDNMIIQNMYNVTVDHVYYNKSIKDITYREYLYAIIEMYGENYVNGNVAEGSQLVDMNKFIKGSFNKAVEDLIYTGKIDSYAIFEAGMTKANPLIISIPVSITWDPFKLGWHYEDVRDIYYNDYTNIFK
jgi:hypothetical protein